MTTLLVMVQASTTHLLLGMVCLSVAPLLHIWWASELSWGSDAGRRDVDENKHRNVSHHRDAGRHGGGRKCAPPPKVSSILPPNSLPPVLSYGLHCGLPQPMVKVRRECTLMKDMPVSQRPF